MNKLIFVTLLFVASLHSAIAEELYPDLKSIKIGVPFTHPQADKSLDLNRPTTQLRVPNYGELSEIFPEYKIIVLNSTKQVVTVTAETVTRNILKCNELLKEFERYPQQRFPDFKTEDSDSSERLGFGSKRFYKDGVNTYYNLTCTGSYGPFITLHYQLRGLAEDTQLKLAWEQMFKNSN